ncbi:MAG: TlpA disulfide reductase family protein [SAR202 cluster bacterium]|nr:TlpA disulfide reductase family protein [SAR202 cluster bacterium]MDP6514077.1 TlpA disulfide reductase family protein [SAR202 cluster bacterium]MDP6713166.1 TlpA disulfide reductase family protein [SAR202 cluster bacterium]
MLRWIGVLAGAVLLGASVACAADEEAVEPLASVIEVSVTPTAVVLRPTATPEVVAPTATPEPTATPRPEPSVTPTTLPTATPDPSTPTPAPTPALIRSTSDASMAHDFEMTLFSGETLALSDLQGQVVVLNFWASWCPPCRWEMASFETMYQEYRDQGVIFVGVAVSDFEEDAREFAELTGVTYPLGRDLSGISRDYRVLSLPTTVFIDTEGQIARTLRNAANEAVLRLFIEGQIRSGNVTPTG